MQLLLDAGFTEVGEAREPKEALDLSRMRDWDLVILDLSLPGRGGLELLSDLKADRPKRPVLILSMHDEDHYALRALRAGASGYLTKDAAGDSLVSAIERVVKGGRYVSAAFAEKLAETVAVEATPTPHAALSDREFEVLCQIGSGKTVSEIGELLSLSVKTISSYRARILEKTGLKNNASMMKYTIDNGLADGAICRPLASRDLGHRG